MDTIKAFYALSWEHFGRGARSAHTGGYLCKVVAFGTRSERDAWVDYAEGRALPCGGTWRADAVTRREAERMAGRFSVEYARDKLPLD